ncbi:hypothetical protein BKA70DRAFT_1577661 [Coprinopsis sp. MPI-PUGE-AT-0042]|nr:hypothetical protein BKA70DRAFT_1577661 [Coprinopsis sp. MPI-PUGE-AT-0042]
MTTGPASSFHSSAAVMSKRYGPKEWRIIPCAPGNTDFVFNNVVEGTMTWYTPEGMTAAEIMQIPRAKNYLLHEGVAESEQKKRDRAKGIFQD